MAGSQPGRSWRLALAGLTLVALASAAQAADVKLSLSSRETFVGAPVTLTVSLEDVNEYDIPRLPKIPGARVSGPSNPRTSSIHTIVNCGVPLGLYVSTCP